jgi:hypothetical protein
MGGIKLFFKKLNIQNRKYLAALISILLAGSSLFVLTFCSKVELRDFIELATEEFELGDIIYVSTTGDDANSGSKSNPTRDRSQTRKQRYRQPLNILKPTIKLAKCASL